tara:strand:- start:579 stop:779 length:201 start_codon:yes stop_codon:yes gene_type:complete
MSITAEEGKTILLAAIKREKVTGSHTRMMEVGDQCIMEIHVDHNDMRIDEISDIIFPALEEIKAEK